MRAALKRWMHEPAAINAAQCVIYLIAGSAGAMAAIGALTPVFMTSTIGPYLIAGVGCILVIGGLIGAAAILKGAWWLERIGIIVMGVGWGMLAVPALYFAIHRPQTAAIWLVVALDATAILSAFIRYRRIDWAYLDPTR